MRNMNVHNHNDHILVEIDLQLHMGYVALGDIVKKFI